jgi:hypothetical protein
MAASKHPVYIAGKFAGLRRNATIQLDQGLVNRVAGKLAGDSCVEGWAKLL